MPTEYNPLDYANLTKHCVAELMNQAPVPLDDVPGTPFTGSGVYALFYTGPFGAYAPVRSPDALWPIYVGKAARITETRLRGELTAARAAEEVARGLAREAGLLR